MVGISAFGGYIPCMRMPRQEIAKANAWMNPSLLGLAKGERAVAQWDEDSVTMAVEASRDCLHGHAGSAVDRVYLASTTLPFADRLNSGIVAGALNLGGKVAASDLTATQRAGLTALNAAFEAVRAGGSRAALVVGSDRRKAAPGSVGEMAQGDGAAAFVVASERPVAEYVGGIAEAVDFVSHYRSAGADFDYEWEERWVRDEGYSKIVPPAVKRLLAENRVVGSEISHFIFPAPAGVAVKIAKDLGIATERVADHLQSCVGDTGVAHPLLILSHVLQRAKPGELVLVGAFGHGVDAMLLRATDAIEAFRPRLGVSGYLERRLEERNYTKLPVFNRLMPYEKGMRAEVDRKATMSLMNRKRDFLESFVGGKCSHCSTVQVPRTRSCVNCGSFDTQEPYPFADVPGKIVSWSADYLAYTVAPPHHFGMIEFSGGGRLMADMADVAVGEIETGTEVRMVFRIKDFDDMRNFRRYFWKATPAFKV